MADLNDIAEAMLLVGDLQRLTAAELARVAGMSVDDIVELVDLGTLEPVGPAAPASAWSFSIQSVVLARTAGRLRRDFDLSGMGLALAITLVERLGEMERRVRELECQVLD